MSVELTKPFLSSETGYNFFCYTREITEVDNCHNISHELHVLREINSEAHKRLEEAYETIRELSSSSKRSGGPSFVETGIQVDDKSMIEHIHNLQQELIEAHSKKADLENSIREMKLRVQELENSNKRLLESPPQDSVASLQEELIRVKMREAESSLALKEMRQRLAELEQHWQVRNLTERTSLSTSINLYYLRNTNRIDKQQKNSHLFNLFRPISATEQQTTELQLPQILFPKQPGKHSPNFPLQ